MKLTFLGKVFLDTLNINIKLVTWKIVRFCKKTLKINKVCLSILAEFYLPRTYRFLNLLLYDVCEKSILAGEVRYCQ